MIDNYEKFLKERNQLNELVLSKADIVTKRFFSLDSQAYRKGALEPKIKEMLGLTASIVLRCDDCIAHHIARCYQEGISDEEIAEVLSIALIVGGSITIPHIRRAYRVWEELKSK